MLLPIGHITEWKKPAADFICEIIVESNDEVDIKNISISINNENIRGCDELT